ncbi:hypothetical protein CPB84DRAFT_176661 [Gymnopilus junonius]|uniref:Uncharacterized protein n=1 Tax=Gymnopilus junonius TaxID=109634 RepID=A0A9P5NGI8_GYMJU|nr:hypothetical protein CPB84DRAFT_176661 [Gymnopilus junonius]
MQSCVERDVDRYVSKAVYMLASLAVVVGNDHQHLRLNAHRGHDDIQCLSNILKVSYIDACGALHLGVWNSELTTTFFPLCPRFFFCRLPFRTKAHSNSSSFCIIRLAPWNRCLYYLQQLTDNPPSREPLLAARAAPLALTQRIEITSDQTLEAAASSGSH